MRNIGLGCLVVLLIFLFFGLSCTRACFRHRRYYRRYGAVIFSVAPPHTFFADYKPAGRQFPIAGRAPVFRDDISTQWDFSGRPGRG